MEIQSLYSLYLEHPVITTDSRDCPQGSLFFALKGDNFDGNQFAAKALEQGCAKVIVDNPDVIPSNDQLYVLVDNVLKSLQDMAHWHRTQFHGPIIQVTGTNGKTTTKELLRAVLSRKYNVLATEGNFNNHIGVPKTLLRLKPFIHQIAIIETGANHPGEIAQLANIVDPDCGLITNVGRAHLEGFGSFEGVIRTKGELYEYLRKKQQGFIFLDADNQHLSSIAQELPACRYGKPGQEGLLVEGEATSAAPFLSLRWKKSTSNQWHHTDTHLIGNYNLQNVMAAICAGVRFGVREEDINEAIAEYTPKNNRSELRITQHNHLIVDAYNANPSSMNAALDNFHLIKAPHKMVILGDMRELGADSQQEHSHIVSRLQQWTDCEEIWLVGEEFAHTHSAFRCFKTVDEVKQELADHPVSNRLILIKGSNGTRLYQLPDLL